MTNEELIKLLQKYPEAKLNAMWLDYGDEIYYNVLSAHYEELHTGEGTITMRIKRD